MGLFVSKRKYFGKDFGGIPGYRLVTLIDNVIAGKSSILLQRSPVCSVLHTRTYSLANMSSEVNWQSEKTRLLEMSVEERRKRFPDPESYVVLDKVEPWRIYTIKNKTLEQKKPTLDDIKEFQKIAIKKDLNEVLLEKVAIYKGDITKLEVDAIVNAANSLLKKGGGVDGAIHRAAGPLLQVECYSLSGCHTGQAKITGGYNLPAKYVIHTVGPQDGNARMLQFCYENSLSLVKQHKLKSVAFPCISTGIYGFPNRLAAHIALRTARLFLENNHENIERIIFCTFMPIDIELYETLLQMYFPTHEWNYNDGTAVTDP